MVLSKFFKRPSTLASHASSAAGPFLDDFVCWLDGFGYSKDAICRRVRGVIRFVEWATERGFSISGFGVGALEDFRDHLAEKGHVRKPGGYYPNDLLAAKHFVEFLSRRNALDHPYQPKPKPELPPIVAEFCQWMRDHRGVTQSTLSHYCLAITCFLESCDTHGQLINARALRSYVSETASRCKLGHTKNVVTALRMFVRFLVAQGKCPHGLDHAIPAVAEWKLSSLPQYIPTDDVARLIASCDPSSIIGARDRAVLLLLAKLGLRAGEVAGMKLGDINWDDGTLVVAGKSRREARLPLPQETGDSILHYLLHSRPQVDTDRIFIRVQAPLEGISRASVSYIVANAIRRAGIKAPHHGAHLLRHSAATTMLRQGASLQEIGCVLRHRSIETTAHYAKVDIGLLKQVALPWPGVTSC